MTGSPSVVGVGNALVDHTLHLTNLPEPDGGAFVLDRERRFGGVEANVATLVAGLGVEAGVLARLGEDPDGRAVREHLAGLPLDVARVRTVAGDETSYTQVLRDPEGRRAIIGGGDSTLNLRLDDADRSYLAAARATVTSAYTPVPVVRDLAELTPPVVFDLAGRFEDLEHRGLTREALDAVCPDLAVLVAGVPAARSYLQRPDLEAPALAARLRDRGVPRVAVTRGERGAVLADDAGRHAVPAVDVDVVDTTGAGDAFTAGLTVAWLLEDRPAAAAGRFAAAAAAANCRVEGAHADPPTRATVEALLEGATG